RAARCELREMHQMPVVRRTDGGALGRGAVLAHRRDPEAVAEGGLTQGEGAEQQAHRSPSGSSVKGMEAREWTAADAARVLRVPSSASHKYSRGVVSLRTGSPRYPGAAVLGVEGAARTGA